MSKENETVTLQRDTYHDLMDESETLRAFQDDGLPILIYDKRIYDPNYGYINKKSYEVLYSGDDELKEAIKNTSETYLKYQEDFQENLNVLIDTNGNLEKSIIFTWIWFIAFAGSIVLHFLRG